jgi:AraC family transcriptional regulator
MDTLITTPDAWADQLSAPAQESSDPRNWPTGLIRHWRGTSPTMDQPVLDHHYVVQHLGGAKHVERRLDGKPVATIVEIGALTIVPAGTSFKWNTRGPIEFAHVYIAPILLQQSAARLSGAHDPLLVDRVGCLDPLLQSVFTAMLAALRLPAEDQSLYLDGLMETFLLKLLRDHCTTKVPQPRSRETLAPFKLKRIVDFVDTYLDRRMTLAQLAQIGECSSFHFSRAFRNSLGETPYQYILRRRVERAKVILAASSVSSAEVAVACGFRDARHLAKTFRRLTGTNPIRFRDKTRTTQKMDVPATMMIGVTRAQGLLNAGGTNSVCGVPTNRETVVSSNARHIRQR